MDSGRPALVVPYIGAAPEPLRRILVAWNGSREAARAVHDALPFLLAAERTTVLIVDPQAQGREVGEQPGADLAAHLARHGVRVEVKTVPGGGLAAGDAILAQAADDGADLLVMGGYGHTAAGVGARWRDPATAGPDDAARAAVALTAAAWSA